MLFRWNKKPKWDKMRPMETPMDIQLIAFDLDGTALTSEKNISPRTRAAFENARKAGKILIPCTGRGSCPVFLTA